MFREFTSAEEKLYIEIVGGKDESVLAAWTTKELPALALEQVDLELLRHDEGCDGYVKAAVVDLVKACKYRTALREKIKLALDQNKKQKLQKVLQLSEQQAIQTRNVLRLRGSDLEQIIPLKCTGYVKKVDSDTGTLDTFFFVLSEGTLSCYSKEAQLGRREGDKNELIGEFDLTGYELQALSPNRMMLFERKEEFGFELEEIDPREYIKWFSAFQEHIEYINKGAVSLAAPILNSDPTHADVFKGKKVDPKPLKCTGYVSMITEDDEDFSVYFFVLNNGLLSCYKKETEIASRVGDENESIGEFDLKGYELNTPSADRMLLYDEQEGFGIQLSDADAREYQKWLVAFQEHIAYRNTPSNSGAVNSTTEVRSTANEGLHRQRSATGLGDIVTKYDYACKTIEILKTQLRTNTKDVIPVEYIPLTDLRREIDEFTVKLQSGHEMNFKEEGRFEYLCLCMNLNPEYIAEEAEKAKQWRADIQAYTTDCLRIMKGFIPPHITKTSQAKLVEEGMAKDLAKRIFTKKCLWVIRMGVDEHGVSDFAKLHIADLKGAYSYGGLKLDIVETAALYACCSTKGYFLNDDAAGSKEQWRTSLEAELKSMYQKLKDKRLVGKELRAIEYKGQLPLYSVDEATKSDITKSS